MNQQQYDSLKEKLDTVCPPLLDDAMLRDSWIRLKHNINDPETTQLLGVVWQEYFDKLEAAHKQIGFTEKLAHEMFLFENRDSEYLQTV